MRDPLVIAERIVGLRAELAAAEAEFQKLVGARPARAKQRAPRGDGTVAARVREFLQSAKGPVAFSEITGALGDVKPEAVKSALKKARAGGTAGFRAFKYYWK